MRLLFFFLDGVGLGQDDPTHNPFAQAKMPHLQSLLGGKRLLAETLHIRAGQSKGTDPGGYRGSKFVTQQATLLALDAGLGVPGLPQSATGQATLLTGQNIPAALGYHYGPKPNPEVAQFLNNGTLFSELLQMGKRVAFLNAYPPSYFHAISSGRRLFSSFPLAATNAGLLLKTATDLSRGQALSADFTGRGWRDNLKLAGYPVLDSRQAGERLASLSMGYDFAFFEFWLSDYAGHRQDMAAACEILEIFDQALGGLTDTWDHKYGVILLTSDHGNLEDLSTRKHTLNPVPALAIGAPELRQSLIASWKDLTDVAPAILRFLLD